jgi:hypothetical protein
VNDAPPAEPAPEATSEADLRVARRRATARVVGDAVGLVVTTLIVGTLFLGPILGVLAASVPQITIALPEPVREVAFVFAGLPGEADAEATGAEGEATAEDAALDEQAPPAGEEAPSAAEEGPAPEVAPTPAEPAPAPPEPGTTAEPPPAEAPPTETVAEPTPPAATQPPANAGGPTPKAGRKGRCGDPVPEIRKLDDGHWEVDRSIVEHYTANLKRFNSLGWSRRYDRDGVQGWQVGGFGCASPLWKAGVRSSDVIRSVNEKKTYNVMQILGIWLGQRGREEFVIEVLRRGEPVTLRYTLVKRGRK